MQPDDPLHTRFARNPLFATRRIAGEVMLVPARQRPGEPASIYTLNEVSAFAWELVDGRRRVADLVAAVVAEFEVTAEVAAADLLDFFRQLEEVGAIEEVPS